MWGDVRHCGPFQVLRSMVLLAACLLCSQRSEGAEADSIDALVSEFVFHPSSAWYADSVTDSFHAPVVDGHTPSRSLTYDPSVQETQFAFQPAFRPPTTSAPTVGRVQSRYSIASSLPSPTPTVDEFWRRLVESSVTFRIPGDESKFRSTGDTVDLIGKAAIPGVNTSAKQPITTTAKVRGGREAQTQKSGSYWVPARMDLDSALSKIDSRLLQDVSIIKGPYSSLYGPGFSFIDSQLRPSPRFEGFQHQASTSIDYKTNGQQWHGRQTVLAGDEDSGFRMSYGHRTGSDYESGNGTSIPTSFHSRDLTFAYGTSLSPHSRIEFSALRLDQTDVELPGQAFDIDFLVTDAYEFEYTNEM